MLWARNWEFRYNHRVDVIAALARAGADVNVPGGEKNCTPLLLAVEVSCSA
jgi:hypothetical protein